MTWLYFKIYCGETIADRLLASDIAPLAVTLQEAGVVTRWFFIRYVDPHHHLRLRFFVDPVREGDVVKALQAQLASAQRNELVWRIQRDRYEPEIERYGVATMALAERLFHRESEMVAKAVTAVRGAGDEHLRWQFGLAAIDRRLEDFGYSPEARVRLLDGLAAALLPEFGEPKQVKARIDARARELKPWVEDALDPVRRRATLGALDDLLDAHSATTESDRNVLLTLSASGEPGLPLEQLLASYLHMFCNRLFVTRQRLHEAVVYSFVAKQLRGATARLSYTPDRRSPP